MEKFLSIILSFFILLSSFPVSVFADETSTGSVLEDLVETNEWENWVLEEAGDINPAEAIEGLNESLEENIWDWEEEILDEEDDLESVITNSWQSWQVLDEVFVLDSNWENEHLNSWNLLEDWQSWQVLEDSNIVPKEDEVINILSEDETIETRSWEPDPELIISEVFFDWFNERIEIYNKWDNFSWDIIFSGASSNNKTINNLIIDSQEVKIFTDTNVDSILDTSYVFQTDMWFSISDSQDMNIQLIYSWQILDSFVLDSSTVSSLANWISFHKYQDTDTIIASDSTHNFNTTTWILANPWIVYDEILPPSDPELIITEVYFDGDEERFEITNIASQEFSWDFSINWNINLNLSSTIPAWISKVFANDLYSMFQTWENIQVISWLINFDTWAIDLDLVRSGQVLDNFFAHETQVNYYDQAETSFEKIGSDSSRTTTVVWLNRDRYFNINRWIAANPTTYFTTWENLIDVTQEKEEETYNQTLPIDCDDFRETSTANITEVYYWNSLYEPYIEIITQDNVYDYYPYIMLEWSALSWSVAFDASDMSINKRFLISSNDQRYNEWRDSLYDSNFYLNSSGRITLYWRDDWSMEWIILDIVYVNNWEEEMSLYAWGQTNDCADIFDYQDKFSPGLSIGQSQFIDITPDPIIQYISVWGWWGCSSDTSPKFNSDNNLTQDIQISVIKHFGNLQILKLKNKTNSDIDLRDYSLQSLDWSTQTIKWNTLFAGKTMSFVWNYWFSTSQDYCVNLINDETWDVIDRYCRNSMSKASDLDEQNIADQLSFRIDEEETIVPEEPVLPSNPMQTNTIKITDIDYNPDWLDKDNETITLLLLSWTQVDLSKYKIQYIKDWKSTNKIIQWILSAWNEQVFKWNYTLPNSTKDKKPVVVNLIDENNYIVDTYIYNPNKIKEIPDWDYEVVSVIDGDTVKISYLQKEFNIRLAWIDAPESSTLRCGKVECYWPEAKNYLQSLLEWQTITFEQESTDSFDRFVWYIFLSWENINKKMIHEWYAREYSYKEKDYKYSSDFKSAQNYAQNNNLGLRWNSCNGQRLCPVDETQINKDYLFNIENIVYDPEWNDSWREEITINMKKWFTVDFADWFYLMINDRKRYLKDHWTISPGQTKTLKWTFSFPNSKKTSVSLSNGEISFDTYVYDPKLDKLLEEEDMLTGESKETEISQLWINISIVSILPNPLWKDTLWEEVWLLYSFDKNAVEEYKQTVISTETQWSGEISLNIESDFSAAVEMTHQVLNLSSGYYLKIWDKKKYLDWELESNQEALITWNFGIPNKAGCVEIGYENHIFDKFCYSEPEEWEKFKISNWVLESVSTIDFGILNKSKLENIWNQVCLTYWSQKFYCKNMPYSKLSTKRVNQNKLYKEFFDSFENYLKDQRKIMYYDTDIKNYFNLLNEIEKAISDWKSTFELDGKTFQTSEFKEMYNTRYPQLASIVLKEKLFEVIPSSIVQKYQQLKDEYIDYLMKQ